MKNVRKDNEIIITYCTFSVQLCIFYLYIKNIQGFLFRSGFCDFQAETVFVCINSVSRVISAAIQSFVAGLQAVRMSSSIFMFR